MKIKRKCTGWAIVTTVARPDGTWYDETITDEYEFEPIKKIYSGNIDIDTKNARYFNIFSSIFEVSILSISNSYCCGLYIS